MSHYNPKSVVCMVCDVTDCEHFDLPESARGFRELVEAGFQPFIWQPYVPFLVTDTIGKTRIVEKEE